MRYRTEADLQVTPAAPRRSLSHRAIFVHGRSAVKFAVKPEWDHVWRYRSSDFPKRFGI